MAPPPPRLPPRLPPRTDRRAGRSGRGAGPVRPPKPLAPKRPAKVSPKEVAAAFTATVRPVRASLGYRLVALIAAGFVLLLPLAYLAVIAATAWAVHYHFTQHAGLLEVGRGRARIFAVLLYLLPGPAGAAVILALLKPLAAREGGRDQWRVLHRKTQPTLFALIDGVCDAVRAPKPDRVHIDAQVNMSAGYKGGFMGLFGGKLILTVGVPLAAGLSAAGFAGVLAHEFGHFAQRGGRGLVRAAMAVQGWLARTVYKRDAVDEWIADGCEAESWLALPFWFCAACVWAVRQFLTGLLYASGAATAALFRQMEFDADRYETRLAGAEAFADTSRRMIELNAGFSGAMAELLPALATGPPEDLPALCVHHAPRLSEAEALAMEDEARGGGFLGGVFSSHPHTSRRLAAARREGERLARGDGPALTLDGPAAGLFADLPALCRDVTLDFYRGAFGVRPDPESLAPVRPLPANPHRPRGSKPRRRKGDPRPAADAAPATDGGPDGEIPDADDAPAWPLPYARAAVEPPRDAAAHRRELAARRRAADAGAAALAKAHARFQKVGERRMRALERLAAAGFAPAARSGGAADVVTLQAKLERADRARDEAELLLSDLERIPAAARLAALDLYAAPAVAAKLPGHVRAGVDGLLGFSAALREAKPVLRELRDAALRLSVGLKAAENSPVASGLRAEATDRAAAVAAALAALERALRGLPDPFAVPEDVKQRPESNPRPLTARVPTPDADAGPFVLLSAAARALHELAAAATHADRVLAGRADWIVGRLKLDDRPAPSGG